MKVDIKDDTLKNLYTHIEKMHDKINVIEQIFYKYENRQQESVREKEFLKRHNELKETHLSRKKQMLLDHLTKLQQQLVKVITKKDISEQELIKEIIHKIST